MTAPEAIYTYTDESGDELYQVVRYPGKKIRQRHRDGNRWKWGLEGVPRVLYHLPEVLAAGNERRAVWLPEGEKDADNLRALGFTATTAPMGASAWRDEYAASFTSCAWVLIVADCDEPGRKFAEQKAAAITATGVRCKVIDLAPERDDGYDVSDFIIEHGDEARARLERVASKTRRWRSPEETPVRPRLSVVAFHDLAAKVGPYDDSRDYLGAFIRGGQRAHIIGPIGHGKTTFMAEAASAAVHGKEFLGFQGKGGAIRALYIDLEMPLELLVETLTAAGFDPNNEPRLDVASYPDGLEVDKNREQREMIEEAVKDYEIVVIDPWFKLIADELSEGMRNVRTVISFLDGIRGRYPDTAVLVGFHANEPQRGQKLGRLGDASGYKAFQRPCDTAVTFERIREDRSRVVWAKTRSKYLPKLGAEWLVEWSRGLGFTLVERRKAEDEMLDYVSGEWQTTTELHEAMGVSRSRASELLSTLLRQGRVERQIVERRAEWRLAHPGQETLAA